MIRINNILNSNIEFKPDVINLANEAREYLLSFNWCKNVKNEWVAAEFGYIFCVFYFEIVPTEGSDADNFVWIIVGDIPSVYVDIVTAPNTKDAIISYCDIMEDWVNKVNNGSQVDECYPISIPATKENADMLKTRIELIKNELLPNLLEL